MNENLKLGKAGEDIAVRFLEDNNYKIIARNYKCVQGEIDIIASYKDEIVFLEVKTRTNRKYGRPIEAVDSLKRKHIWKTAKYFLYSNRLLDNFIRFDVIEVYVINEKVYVNQIKNIFI